MAVVAVVVVVVVAAVVVVANFPLVLVEVKMAPLGLSSCSSSNMCLGRCKSGRGGCCFVLVVVVVHGHKDWPVVY